MLTHKWSSNPLRIEKNTTRNQNTPARNKIRTRINTLPCVFQVKPIGNCLFWPSPYKATLIPFLFLSLLLFSTKLPLDPCHPPVPYLGVASPQSLESFSSLCSPPPISTVMVPPSHHRAAIRFCRGHTSLIPPRWQAASTSMVETRFKRCDPLRLDPTHW